MSFKIEGRMKTPEYVGTVTRIYRKYIDLAQSDKEYKVDESDRKLLMQVFNRGGFSTGYCVRAAIKYKWLHGTITKTLTHLRW